MSRAGFVLAGGRSSRMGRDKALLPYRGTTLIEYLAGEVRQAAGSVCLVGPPERYRVLPFPVLPDLYPDGGPAAGIHAALRATRADWNLIVACDMPALTAAFLAELLERAESAGRRGLVPLAPSGRSQPLCAVYHRACLPALERGLEAGRRKLTDLIADLDLAVWPVAEARWFQNPNTPAEWAAIVSP